MNPTKTEAIVFGTAARLKAVDMSGGIMAAGSNIKFSDAVKLLGVNLDRCLTMDSHVASVVRSCNFHIRALRHIRPRLSPTLDAAKSVAVSIIGSHLDYCNSLLHGSSQRNFDRLQRVQKALASAVTQASWRSGATELRQELHWLPIRQRVEFKLGVIARKVIYTGTPPCHRHQSSTAITVAAFKHCSTPASTVCSFKLLQELIFHCWSCSVESAAVFNSQFFNCF